MNREEKFESAVRRLYEHDETLTDIALVSNQIDDDDVNRLVDALRDNDTVTDLDLRGNTITDVGAVVLTEWLQFNTTLRGLRLSRNNIGTEGAVALAESLKENSTLTHLVLNDNNIGNEGANALSHTLRVNDTLQRLNLNINPIDYEGGNKLLEALKCNATLRKLIVEKGSALQKHIDKLTYWNEWGALGPHNEVKYCGYNTQTLPQVCQDFKVFLLLVLRQIPICDDLHWLIISMIRVKDLVRSGHPGNVKSWVLIGNVIITEEQDYQENIRHKQKRLLLLHHSSKCPIDDGSCHVTRHCAKMKRLWKHMAQCYNTNCRVSHCYSSRCILSHFRKCKDVKCPSCGPVRESVRKSGENPNVNLISNSDLPLEVDLDEIDN